MRSNRLTVAILVGLIAGIGVGYLVNARFAGQAAEFASRIEILPDAFLRLIKMIIAPLVFSTMVTGMAKMGDVATVGRVGGKALAWFALASILSLTLGLVLVGWLQPGAGIHVEIPNASVIPNATGTAGVTSAPLTVNTFIAHLIPTSIVDAMSRNEILQIVVFSVFFGIAMAALKDHVRNLLGALETVSHVMLKVTSYVMLFAPLAVFGAIASMVAKQGLDIIGTYGLFVGEFYAGLVVLALVLIGLGVAIVGPRLLGLMQRTREPFLIAFSTASSEAAYPKTLEELERFGCSNRIASFVLPVGYSFNLDGSMMYQTFAIMFIAQVYGVQLSFGQQVLMVGLLMLTSKGIAGVPRASLVVVAATLPQFNIPDAGIVLVLGVEHFLDMGRSATNVIGNSIATAVVSKWEGELK
jgi:Na+/H+-dicarboxylate symporter